MGWEQVAVNDRGRYEQVDSHVVQPGRQQYSGNKKQEVQDSYILATVTEELR